MKAGDEGFFERRKINPPKQRLPLQKRTKKDEFDLACYSGNVSSSNEMHYLLLTLLIMKLTISL